MQTVLSLPCSLGCFSFIAQSKSLTHTRVHTHTHTQAPILWALHLPELLFSQGSFVRNSFGLASVTTKLTGKWKAGSSCFLVLLNKSLSPSLGSAIPSEKTAFQLSKTSIDPHGRIICSCLRDVYLFWGCKHCHEDFDRSEK